MTERVTRARPAVAEEAIDRLGKHGALRHWFASDRMTVAKCSCETIYHNQEMSEAEELTLYASKTLRAHRTSCPTFEAALASCWVAYSLARSSATTRIVQHGCERCGYYNCAEIEDGSNLRI
jgi:hypothetical protein